MGSGCPTSREMQSEGAAMDLSPWQRLQVLPADARLLPIPHPPFPTFLWRPLH